MRILTFMFFALCVLHCLGEMQSTNVNGVVYYYVPEWSSGPDDGIRVVAGSDKYTGQLNVPAELAGYKVVSVVIDSCPSLVSVSIPKSVASFWIQNCCAVEEVWMPDSVTDFMLQCNAGLKKVHLSSGLTKIRSNAFISCTSLEEIEIPEGVIEIEYQAFQGCSALTHISLPHTLLKIGDEAFVGCSKLTTISIPENVSTIEDGILYGCHSLVNISVAKANSSFKVVNDCLVTMSGKTLIAAANPNGRIVVPDGVTSIPSGAFQGNRYITSITLPETVVAIADYAFGWCTGLSSIVMPSGVVSIGAWAFMDCSFSSLTFVGDEPNVLGYNWLYQCAENLVIYAYNDTKGWPTEGYWQGRPLVLLDRWAAYKHKITFESEGVMESLSDRICREGEMIGELPKLERYGYSFVGWFAEAEGDVPYTAESIMPAYDLCLTARWEKKRYDVIFELGLGLPSEQITREYLDVIGDMPIPVVEGRDFLGWFTDEGEGERISGDAQVAADMTLYAHWAFETIRDGRMWRFIVRDGCARLLPVEEDSVSLIVPSELNGFSVREIPDACFANCSNLTSVTLPTSITNIGAYAFYNCINLKNVVFKEGLISIGDGAFAKCESIEKISLPSTVLSIGSLLAPINAVAEAHEKSETHYRFETNYVDEARCVREIRSSKEANVYSSRNAGLGVFESCLSLEDVSLNDGLQSIGAGAFKDCKNLVDLAIPGSVSSIGGSAETLAKSNRESTSNEYDLLQEEGGQPSILTAESKISDESSSFAHVDSGFLEGCSALSSVQLPKRLKYLGPNSFAGCSNLTSVELPASLEVLNRGTFSRCKKLSKIRFPDNLELIGGCELPHLECESSAYDALRKNGGKWSVLTQDWVFKTVNGHWVDSLSQNGSEPSVIEGGEEDRRWLSDLNGVRIPVDEAAFSDWFYRWKGAEVLNNVACPLTDDERSKVRIRFASVRPKEPSFGSPNCGVFYGCSSLREVCLPQSVRRIADYSFYDCCNLVKIELPKRLDVLGYEVFGGETALMDIATPWFDFGSLWEIFPSHSYVTNLVILSSPPHIMDPNDVFKFVMKDIRGEAFTLEEANARMIPLSVDERRQVGRTILDDLWITQDEVLYGFWNLKSLTLPEGLRSFDWTVGWWSTQKLLDVVLPNTLVGLGWRAFAGFPLEHIAIPSSLQTMEDEVFLESNVSDVLFMGNAPCDVSPNVFVESTGWDPDYAAREDLVVRVYPGTLGWDGDCESAALPADGLWPARAAVYKRRPIQFVQQPLAVVLGGEGGTDALTYFDATANRLVTVPQTWLNSYGLLSVDAVGAAGVANLSPLASRTLYDSYVAGLDPTDEKSQFKVKIEIVNNEPVISWEPELTPEEALKRKYTVYGSAELGGEWREVEDVSAETLPRLRFFKVGVEMR